jgi:hypothetical protein
VLRQLVIIKITTEQKSDRKINKQQNKIDKLELVSIFPKVRLSSEDSMDLLGGMGNNTLVVWGNGNFGLTSKGHDSASNKRFQRLLSRYMPIVLGTEYNTSKLSCCCHVEAKKLTTKNYKKRGTVLRCDALQ